MLLCNTIAIASGYIFFSILIYSGKMYSQTPYINVTA